MDWFGSLLVTASLMSAIYAIVQATTHGWLSAPVLEIGALAVLLMAAFISVEARVHNPIMPLRILRLPGLINASLVRGFLVTGMYSTFFLGTLYLEQVRHYSALQTGAAFLPWTLTVAVLSQGITARLVARWGPLPVLTAGMASAIAGLLLFSTVGPDTAFFPTIFFACFAIGLGNRQRLHAAADNRDGRRSRRGRRAGIGHHQRCPADQRRTRTGRAQHASPPTTRGDCWRSTTEPPAPLSTATSSHSSPARERSRSEWSSRSRSCDRARLSRASAGPNSTRPPRPMHSTSKGKQHDPDQPPPPRTRLLRRSGRRLHPRDLDPSPSSGRPAPRRPARTRREAC